MKTIIIVVGMHRSGTSVISRSLSVLNIPLGNNLMTADDSNPKGYYEDMDIYELNERLLWHIGQLWDTSEPLPIDVHSSLYEKFGSEAIELIKTKMINTDIFSFKDPRNSIFLPFWKKVIETLNIQIKYIFVFRNPLSVIDSLFKRDEFTREKSLRLWLKYNLLGLSGIDKDNSIFVDYDAALMNLPNHISRLSKFLDMQVDQADKDKFIHEFIDKNLRHSKYRSVEVLDDKNIHPIFKNIYRTMIVMSMTDRCKDLTDANIARWIDWYSKVSNGVIDSGYDMVLLS